MMKSFMAKDHWQGRMPGMSGKNLLTSDCCSAICLRIREQNLCLWVASLDKQPSGITRKVWIGILLDYGVHQGVQRLVRDLESLLQK